MATLFSLCKSRTVIELIVLFLLLSRYVPNVAKSSTWEDRPAHLAFWKISNGHISATGHRIQGRLSPNANDANSPSPPFPSSFPFHSRLPFPSLALSLPQYPLSPFPPSCFPSFPFPLPLNGPLKWQGVWKSALAPPAGFGAVRGGAPVANAFWVNLEPGKRI